MIPDVIWPRCRGTGRPDRVFVFERAVQCACDASAVRARTLERVLQVCYQLAICLCGLIASFFVFLL